MEARSSSPPQTPVHVGVLSVLQSSIVTSGYVLGFSISQCVSVQV